MTKDKIPSELASIVDDYETVTEVRCVPSIDGKQRNEFWVIGTRMWNDVISHIEEQDYKVTGVDTHREVTNDREPIRMWIRDKDEL